jgi:hypothetical protein
MAGICMILTADVMHQFHTLQSPFLPKFSGGDWQSTAIYLLVRVRIPQCENFFGLVDSYVEFFNTMSNLEGHPRGGNLTFVECHVEYYTIS